MPDPAALHPDTLVFCIGVFGFLMAAVALGTLRLRAGADGGQRAWGAAMVATGVACLLYFLRASLPGWVSNTVAPLLCLAAAASALRAHAHHFGVAAPRVPLVAITLFGATGLAGSRVFGQPPALAVFTLCTALGMSALLLAVLLWRHAGRQRPAALALAAGGSTVLASLLLWRAMQALGEAEAGVVPAVTAGPGSAGLLLAGAVAMVANTTNFVQMVQDRAQREALDRSRRDDLTGLYNRSAFFERARQVAASPGRPGYAVVMIDIDHFKGVNDAFGHAGGDVALVHAGQLIARSVRSADVAGRYGGEEFCVLLAGCGLQEARAFAERLVADAAQQEVRLGNGRCLRYTVSAGYAVCPAPHGAGAPVPSLMALLEQADEALYAAKHAGRNRAMAAPLPTANALAATA